MRITWKKKALDASVLSNLFPELWRFASDDETAIWYSPKFREFSIPVIDGTPSSSIRIRHDPWTGQELPESLRHRWFDEVVALGFKDSLETIYDKKLPAEFQSEDWWVRRGL